MLHFIWGILNLVIFIYFLIVVFKSFNLIRQNISGFASIVYIIGILSVFSLINENYYNKKTNQSNYTEFDKIKITNIIIEKHWFTKYYMDAYIGFNTNNNSEKIINVDSAIYGFVSGLKYEQTNFIINKLDKNLYSYEIYGSENWKLLGITIYTNTKEFKGKFNLK